MNGNGLGRTAADGEQGQAFLEFALVLPFLILLLAGILDVGLMINEHLSLTSVAQTGTRLAQQTINLELDTYGADGNLRSAYVNTTLEPCRRGVVNYITPPPDPPAQQVLVHERLVRVLCLLEERGNFRFLEKTDRGGLPNLDIVFFLNRDVAQDTVELTLTARYNAFLPFFDGLALSVKSSAPYLY